MKTAREALANHLSMDMSNMKYYVYQDGRYTKTVYALNDAYYCAAKDANKLPKPTRKETAPFNWIEIPDTWVNRYGWKIFRATETID